MVHSHFFEHLLNPDVFLKTIYNSLNDNGYHIFSVPNMYKLIKAGMPNAVFLNIHIIMMKIIALFLKEWISNKKKIYFGKQHSIFLLPKK